MAYFSRTAPAFRRRPAPHRCRDQERLRQPRAGEIVCVLARASSDYMSTTTAWSALIALIAPWFLIALTNLSVREIFLAQIVLFVVLFLILSESALQPYLIPRRARRAQAHRAAMEQFVIRGMARKKNRAGVLIFVSLAEHYARIVADDGIAVQGRSIRLAGRDRCASVVRGLRRNRGRVYHCGREMRQAS